MGEINFSKLEEVAGIKLHQESSSQNEEEDQEEKPEIIENLEITDIDKQLLTGLGYTEDDIKAFESGTAKEIISKGTKKGAASGGDKGEEKRTIQIGGKWYSDGEIEKMSGEHFKTDISKLDKETKKIYIDTYINAKNGMNKEAWQKAQGRREQEIKAEKEKIKADKAEVAEAFNTLKREKTELDSEKQKLKEILSIDLNSEEYDDLNPLELAQKVSAQLDAKKRLNEIDCKEKNRLYAVQREIELKQ